MCYPPIFGGNRVEICHKIGNGNFFTLAVSSNAVQAHLDRHGDILGNCDDLCEILCDDDNYCTIDTCDGNGCAQPMPVSCEDGLIYTVNTCVSPDGCVTSVSTDCTCILGTPFCNSISNQCDCDVTAGKPTMVAPTMVAPTMSSPTMVAPTMSSPTLSAPTMVAPTMMAPTMLSPTAPTMSSPTSPTMF